VEKWGTIPQDKERWGSEFTDEDVPELEQWDLQATGYFSLVLLRVLRVGA